MNFEMLSATMPGWQASCFASLLAVVLALIHRFNPYPGTIVPDAYQLYEEYDFVIIGAGTAGAVVANRLSEVEDWSVLLLEAGGLETEVSQIPSEAVQLTDTELDWKFRTAPPIGNQRYCLSMTNLECKYPRGKVNGGTSVLNYVLYVRGNRLDYDHWESLSNEGWGYEQILKYFLKSENNSNVHFLETPYHAAGGYLNVQDLPFHSPLNPVFVEAGKFWGYDYTDINGRNQTGFTLPQGMLSQGSRFSSARAFILPILRRKNLTLSLHSFVIRINFENVNTGPRASSVTFLKNGKEYTVKARKEVIVCGGTFSSAQLLMLSGIGPAEHLRQLEIRVVKDLKVGYNLQDHVGTPLTFRTSANVTLTPTNSMNPDNVLEYFLYGKGPLTLPAGFEGMAFVNSEFADPSGAYPDIQINSLPISIFNSGLKPIGNLQYGLRPDLFNGTGYDTLEGENLFTVTPTLLRPKSRGLVKLRSGNPFDPPIIDINYFGKRKDVDVLIAGLRMILRPVTTPPYRAIGSTPLDIPFPGCEEYEMYSDGYLECMLRHFTSPFNHPVGTCAMGITSEAVVDPRLRVHGIKGLRVIDASIMPFITTGNVDAPVTMIAEKGSDMVKEDWQFSGM